jgi:hypothetical protein
MTARDDATRLRRPSREWIGMTLKVSSDRRMKSNRAALQGRIAVACVVAERDFLTAIERRPASQVNRKMTVRDDAKRLRRPLPEWRETTP